MYSENRFTTINRRDFLRLGGAGLAGATLLGTAGGRGLAQTRSFLGAEVENAARKYEVPVQEHSGRGGEANGSLRSSTQERSLCQHRGRRGLPFRPCRKDQAEETGWLAGGALPVRGHGPVHQPVYGVLREGAS